MTEDIWLRLLSFLRQRVDDTPIDFAGRPRRAGGGASTNVVFRFQLSGSAGAWGGPLVLRLYGPASPPGQVLLEAAIQIGVSDAGFPAPRPLAAVADTEVLGRSFMIMPYLPGRPVLRGIRWDRFLRDFPAMVSGWPATAARVARRLHQIDPATVLHAARAHGLDEEEISTRRHLRFVEDRLERFGGPAMADALSWLRQNEPPAPSTASVVHGDLWPGNVLVQRGQLAGLVDWDRAAVGDPALDIGFARAGLALMPAPFPPPPPIAQAIRAAGHSMATRLVEACDHLGGDAAARITYYEALRCALELAAVIEYHSATPAIDPLPWDRGVISLARHFKTITGVALEPPPIHR